MTEIDLATKVVDLFIYQAKSQFGVRAISIFAMGSLVHGGFTKCSDVDVALILDKILSTDSQKIERLLNHIKDCGLPYADRLSIFWLSYEIENTQVNKGRFPALDLVDLIDHGKLLWGEDKRQLLVKPSAEQVILESADFIFTYMLISKKWLELIQSPELILAQGARYFSKFVLFPVRLLYTLDNPLVIASNQRAAEYFCQKNATVEINELVRAALKARDLPFDQPIQYSLNKFSKALKLLYIACIERYADAAKNLSQQVIAEQLLATVADLKKKI